MIEGFLQREKHPLVTPGTLHLPWNHPKIYTMELPWKDNQHDISCIPAGTYIFMPFDSPKKGRVWKAIDVPKRSDIEIHGANFACDCILDGVQKHTELLGCIAPGFGKVLSVPMITDSHNAMQYLLNLMPGKPLKLTIKDAP